MSVIYHLAGLGGARKDSLPIKVMYLGVRIRRGLPFLFLDFFGFFCIFLVIHTCDTSGGVWFLNDTFYRTHPDLASVSVGKRYWWNVMPVLSDGQQSIRSLDVKWRDT